MAAVGDEAASEVVLTKLNQNCQPYGEDSSAESSTRPPMQRRRRQTEMKLSLAGKFLYIIQIGWSSECGIT